MNSDNDLLHQTHPIQKNPNSSFKSLKPLVLLAVVFFIAVVAGVGGYWLGRRTGQKSEIISQTTPIVTTIPTTTAMATPKPTVSLTTLPVMPTQIPALTANWKTYINTQWGLSFKYPEAWFPQEVPRWMDPHGDTIDFYPNGVTPHPGGADEPTNSVLTVENQSRSEKDIEQIMSVARQTYGQRVLNVAGKSAIKGGATEGDTNRPEWDTYYIIKLSSTRLLILAPNAEDGAKRLDTIISTIKFTFTNE